MRMIERARMEPHARGPEGPGVAYGAGEEMLAEALADGARDEPEVGDLDGAVLGHAAQLVPPRERAAPPRDVQGDLGLAEVRADLLVGPVPTVAPVVGRADAAVALAIQLGRRPLDPLDHEVRERAEPGLELTLARELEICTRGFHTGILPNDLQPHGDRSPPARVAPRELHRARTVLLLRGIAQFDRPRQDSARLDVPRRVRVQLGVRLRHPDGAEGSRDPRLPWERRVAHRRRRRGRPIRVRLSPHRAARGPR